MGSDLTRDSYCGNIFIEIFLFCDRTCCLGDHYSGYQTGFHLLTFAWRVQSPHWGRMTHIQYITRNMHTVFALLCFVVVIHWLVFLYPSGLLHWHCGNLTIAPVPAKQPWWIWINTSCEFIMNDCITTTKQSTTKPCAYFLGYTVCVSDLIIIGSDNGLSFGRCQAIIWTNAGILLLRHLGTKFSGILYFKFERFQSGKYTWKRRLQNGGQFVAASMHQMYND